MLVKFFFELFIKESIIKTSRPLVNKLMQVWLPIKPRPPVIKTKDKKFKIIHHIIVHSKNLNIHSKTY